MVFDVGMGPGLLILVAAVAVQERRPPNCAGVRSDCAERVGSASRDVRVRRTGYGSTLIS